jgi:hypothetical protein
MSDSLWSRSLRSLAALGGEHYHPADAPSIWLFYLTIFSALSGAITSLAATRSRALWLRAHWTRGELFARVEAAFWRHNSYALGVLLIVLVAIGTYVGLSTQLLGFGLPLLLLGSAVSTYLGLMMTRGIGWLESVLAVGSSAFVPRLSTLPA